MLEGSFYELPPVALIETLEEFDDVQNVYANFEVSDALVSKMSA